MLVIYHLVKMDNELDYQFYQHDTLIYTWKNLSNILFPLWSSQHLTKYKLQYANLALSTLDQSHHACVILACLKQGFMALSTLDQSQLCLKEEVFDTGVFSYSFII